MIDTLNLARDKITAVTGFYIIDGQEPRRPGGRVTGTKIIARFGQPAELA